MRSHSVDGASLVPLGQISQWKAIPNVRVVTGPGLQTIFFTLDIANPPSMICMYARHLPTRWTEKVSPQAVFKGYAQPANAMVPPDGWANLLSKQAITQIFVTFPQYSFDMSKARAELAQSAHPKGFHGDRDLPGFLAGAWAYRQILART